VNNQNFCDVVWGLVADKTIDEAFPILRDQFPGIDDARLRAELETAHMMRRMPRPEPLVAEPPAPEPEPAKPASEPEPPLPKVKRATVSDEVRAERKAHKLVEDVPATMNLAIAGEWRRYPGMPEVLINVNQVAVVQKTSRRRGTFYRLLPRTAWQGREFWRHSKRGKKIVIPIKRAMFEVGFWTRRKSCRDENE
jgi:hypothetical protein